MIQPQPRVLLLWHCLTGYWAAGIRALAERAEVTVLARPPDPLAPYDYAALDLGGAELQVATWPWSFSLLDELFERTRPDLVCSIGRNEGVLRALHRARRRHHSVTVMFTDNSWTGSSRQRLAQIVFPLVRRYSYDAAFVPGARSADYVVRLGFSPATVLTGACTADYVPFERVAAGSAARWTDPSLLFVGRLVPDKGPDVLAEGYRRYRDSVVRPWPLNVVGHGPFDGGLRGSPGVTVNDFTQPVALPSIFAAAGALVLPSRFDPWGVVALEACAAGLPVVISDGCGAAHEMATPANGFTVAAGDPASLAQALTTLTGAGADQRKAWGRNSCDIASAYRPERWADSLLSACR
jgi:glycosyltransferase involved in cell wall biosynthesis